MLSNIILSSFSTKLDLVETLNPYSGDSLSPNVEFPILLGELSCENDSTDHRLLCCAKSTYSFCIFFVATAI
jgi:hypothetical protein